jgi:thioredoxin-related protein
MKDPSVRLTIPVLLLLTLLLPLYAFAEPKLKLLYVEMKACPWCHRMNSEVFENPKIAQKLKQMYTIEKRLRGDKDLPASVKPKYYPTTYIFSADGKKLLDELPGYMNPDRFLDYLTQLYEMEHEGE